MKIDPVRNWMNSFDKNPLEAVHELLIRCVYMGPLMDACKPWVLMGILFSGQDKAYRRSTLDLAINRWLGKFLTEDEAFEGIRPRLVYEAVNGVMELIDLLGLDCSSAFIRGNVSVIRKKLNSYKSRTGPWCIVFVPEDYLGTPEAFLTVKVKCATCQVSRFKMENIIFDFYR